jgi:hypothetical protein
MRMHASSPKRPASPGSRPDILSAGMPLHLEDHLDAAELEGSEIPADLPQPIE